MSQLQDQSPRHRKWLLRHDHKQVLALFRSSRFWGWFALAWLPALCAIGYRTLTEFSIGPVVGGAFISAGVTAILVQSLLRRMVISNVGVFLRESEPIRFWFSNLLLVLGYCVVILGILKA